MTRMLCVVVLGFCAAGCRVNRAPMYLYMTTDEMQRSIDERYCAGMPAGDVIARLDADDMTYFAERDATGTLGTIEVRIMALGVLRQTRPAFGRMIMGFHENRLISIDYGHPDEERAERWVFNSFQLESCEATGFAPARPGSSAGADE